MTDPTGFVGSRIEDAKQEKYDRLVAKINLEFGKLSHGVQQHLIQKLGAKLTNVLSAANLEKSGVSRPDAKNNSTTRQSPTKTVEVTITYDKQVHAMQVKTNEYIEKISADAGVDSVNISATTNGVHAPNSNHYSGNAADINKIDKKHVITAGNDSSMAASVRALQKAANSPKNGVAHENYGPAGLYKDGKKFTNAKLQAEHEHHVHITVPRSTNGRN